MAKKGARRKLKTKLTSIARLFRYDKPLQMVNDPIHGGSWERRQELLYTNLMIVKRGGWSDAIYREAEHCNLRYDIIWRNATDDIPKWDGSDPRMTTMAERDNWDWDFDQANKDNAAYDLDVLADIRERIEAAI